MDKLTYHRALHQTARQRPDDLALCFKGKSAQALTYRELDFHSSRAAQTLLAAGCGQGMFIPLMLNRGLDCLVWALGIIKTGAAVVPLAEDTPLPRARHIFNDTGAPFILAHPGLATRLPGLPVQPVTPDIWGQGEAVEEEPCSPAPGRPDHPMLVYYTSGTTGRPKGVAVTHANVLGFARRHNAACHIGPGTRVAAYATVSFDAFIMDAYAPLLAGARVYLLGEADRMSLVALHRYYMRHKIEVSFLTTRLGEAYMQAFDNPHLKYLLTGGEVLRTFVPRSYRIMNLYGPTETTSYVTACPLTEAMDDYPLGRPLEGMRVMVLDETGVPCPPGRTGEICISGDQVSPGYIKRPRETARVFVPTPRFDPKTDGPAFSRMYRTGDSGEMDEEGCLYFRGRKDHQIKIRGFRIEPGEVEAALLEHPQVSQAHVRPFMTENREARLAAYVVRDAGQMETREFFSSIKAYLTDTLPLQMVPSCMGELDCFPLNANGKVDVSALPEPAALNRL